MAHDTDLAGRVRHIVEAEDGVAEKRMLGGLALLIDGNLAVSASSQLASDDDLRRWVIRGVGYARALPAKRGSAP